MENASMYTLIYKSQFSPVISLVDVDNIHTVAQMRNYNHSITGCLYFTMPYVMQILQGQDAYVNQLYANIQKDSRHHSVVLLMAEDHPTQLFPEWSMKKVSIRSEKTYARFVNIFDRAFTPGVILDLVAIAADNQDW